MRYLDLLRSETHYAIINRNCSKSCPPRELAIIHLNGSVPLLQDARSIMLAREGYIVLELCYNMPQFGQEFLFTRTSPIQMEYIENAIKKVLSQAKCYGDRVCLIGHSKGCDLVLGAASLMPQIVELAITSCGLLTFPLGHKISYGDIEYEDTMFGLQKGTQCGDGFFQLYHYQNKPLFEKVNEEWTLNQTVLQNLKHYGFNLDKVNKIFHHQTVCDPTHSPSDKESKFITNFLLEGLSNVETEFYRAGHLCLLPFAPMIDSSTWKIDQNRILVNWSRCVTNEEKITESYECQRMFSNVLRTLEKHF